MGSGVSDDQPDVAPELGTPDAIFRLSGGHPQGDLYDQRGRIAEHVAAEGDQNQRLVTEPGSCVRAAVTRLGTHSQKVDHADTELESSITAIFHSAPRPRSANRNTV